MQSHMHKFVFNCVLRPQGFIIISLYCYEIDEKWIFLRSTFKKNTK